MDKHITRRGFLGGAAGLAAALGVHYKAHAKPAAEPWTFIHVTDIHVGSPRSFRFAPAWNENWQTARKQIVDRKPDLLLVGGDLTRDGSIHRFELEAIKADLDALPFPYHVTPGNMDTGNKHTGKQGVRKNRDDLALNMTSAQLKQFEDVFGPHCWTFLHKNVRFSSFCDMVAGSGLPEEAPFWEWMEAQEDAAQATCHVWMMHSALFTETLDEPNYDIADPDEYLNWYFGVDEPHRSRIMKTLKATGADLLLSGHVHCRRWREAEGVRFHINPSTAFKQWGGHWPDGDDSLGFVEYTVSAGDITAEYIPLAAESHAKGYGPGGHPKPEERDYTIAWEK
ncbi:MAG: metallophosphoesterase family protein [Candidatus Hydrogenedentota bacterium]